jgi:hypothetical protein
VICLVHAMQIRWLRSSRGGGAHRLGFRRASLACCALEATASDVMVVLRGKEEDDKVRLDEGSPGASSSVSISSSSGWEGRLEVAMVQERFGRW